MHGHDKLVDDKLKCTHGGNNLGRAKKYFLTVRTNKQKERERGEKTHSHEHNRGMARSRGTGERQDRHELGARHCAD